MDAMARALILLALPVLVLAAPAPLAAEPLTAEPAVAGTEWMEVLPGLEVGEFPPPDQSPGAGKMPVVVARVDPSRLSLVLLCASSPGESPATVGQWVRNKGLACGINASMYLPDGRKSTGYLASRGVLNNARVNRRFGAFLVFDPGEEGLSPARLLDREMEDVDAILPHYRSAVQNFRLIGGDGSITWKPGGETHSVACVAEDASGRVLFIHSQSAYTVHDFAKTLLALPLAVSRAMYVEGGYQASLVVDVPGFFLEISGVSACRGPDPPPCPGWPVPNVLGAGPRAAGSVR